MTKWIAVVLGLVALVAGAVLTTLAVAAPGPGARGTTRAADDLRLASATLRPAGTCEELLAQYVERGLAQVGAYGWDAGPIVMFDAMGSATGGITGGAARSESAAAPLPTTTGASSTGSGTNVQEAGVDEPDVVKVAGELVLRVRADVLTVHDVSGTTPRLLSSLTLAGLRDAELLVSGDRVVVLGSVEGPAEAGGTGGSMESSAGTYDGFPAAPRTRVVVLDLGDPGAPQVVDTTDYDAELTAARLHDGAGDGAGGGVVRLVLRTYRPALDFVQPAPGRSREASLAHNRRVVRDSTLADWLPTTDGEPVVDCGDVAVPSDEDAALGTTTVLGFRPADPDPLGAPLATAVAADAATSYFSPDRFYLATTATPGWWTTGTPACIDRCAPGPMTGGGAALSDGTTDLYAFALDGAATTFVAGGEVDGTVRDRWAMDFAGGTLRVAVGTTVTRGASGSSPSSSVVTLREDAGGLVELGRVDGLGIGEDLKAVRWFDDVAIVVTFRQVDPLYAVDLTAPAAPRLLGELKVPGYSDYLQPLGGRRLLGIGQDASADGALRGAQAALFDVTDLTAPERLDAVAFPPFSVAGAGTDPRQLTWLPDARIALAVVSEGWSEGPVWVSVMRLGADRIRNEMVEVHGLGHGGELEDVRLVPLADGRVVLVAGADLSFLAL